MTLSKDDFVPDELEAMLNTELCKDFMADYYGDNLILTTWDDIKESIQAINRDKMIVNMAAILAVQTWRGITAFCDKYPQYHPGSDDDDAEYIYAEEKRLDDIQRAKDMNQELKRGPLE